MIGAVMPRNWGMWASLYSQGRIRYAGAAATAGFTSAQILAATESLLATPPSRPIAYATVLAGTNDVGDGIPLSTSQANLTAIYKLLVAHGITPVLCTLPPRNFKPEKSGEPELPEGAQINQKNDTILLNQWIAHTAQVNGWPLVDLYSVLVDPATGEYKSGLNFDKLHQNSAGAKLMGQALANALAGYPLAPAPVLADSQADTAYAIPNNVFLESSDGLPTGWLQSGSPALEVSPDPAVDGSAFTITRGTSQDGAVWASSTMTVNQGDVVYLAGRLQSTVPASGSIYYRLLSYPSGAVTVFGLYEWDQDILEAGQWATFAVETTVPNLGSDNQLLLQAIVAGAPETKLKLAQVTWLNMTQSGVLPG